MLKVFVTQAEHKAVPKVTMFLGASPYAYGPFDMCASMGSVKEASTLPTLSKNFSCNARHDTGSEGWCSEYTIRWPKGFTFSLDTQNPHNYVALARIEVNA